MKLAKTKPQIQFIVVEIGHNLNEIHVKCTQMKSALANQSASIGQPCTVWTN